MRDLTRVLDWITACAVLHNFLVDKREIIQSGACTEHHGTHPIGHPEALVTPEQLQSGQEFRASIMPDVLTAGHAPHGILTYLDR